MTCGWTCFSWDTRCDILRHVNKVEMVRKCARNYAEWGCSVHTLCRVKWIIFICKRNQLQQKERFVKKNGVLTSNSIRDTNLHEELGDEGQYCHPICWSTRAMEKYFFHFFLSLLFVFVDLDGWGFPIGSQGSRCKRFSIITPTLYSDRKFVSPFLPACPVIPHIQFWPFFGRPLSSRSPRFPVIFVNFGPTPLFSVVRSTFVRPKKSPKVFKFFSTENFGLCWAALSKMSGFTPYWILVNFGRPSWITRLIFQNVITPQHFEPPETPPKKHPQRNTPKETPPPSPPHRTLLSSLPSSPQKHPPSPPPTRNTPPPQGHTPPHHQETPPPQKQHPK